MAQTQSQDWEVVCLLEEWQRDSCKYRAQCSVAWNPDENGSVGGASGGLETVLSC